MQKMTSTSIPKHSEYTGSKPYYPIGVRHYPIDPQLVSIIAAIALLLFPLPILPDP